MPISKTYLPDVNVWVAMALDAHVHNQAAMGWFNHIEETVAFCRITQMGFLRLLTNRKVMGQEVLTPEQAWTNFDRLRQDPHVTFLNEPYRLEESWRMLSEQRNLPSAWTDAYLLAFAQAHDLTFVTFDQALGAASGSPILLL